MKCSNRAFVWLDSSLFLFQIVICTGLVQTAFGDYVVRDSNDWLTDELEATRDSSLPSPGKRVVASKSSIDNNNISSLPRTTEYNSTAIYRPLTALFHAENITAKINARRAGVNGTYTKNHQEEAKNYLSSSALLSANEKSTSTQQRSRILSQLVSSTHHFTTTTATTTTRKLNSEFRTGFMRVPSQTGKSKRPTFWDYGSKDDVIPADYDYQDVLNDRPETSCDGFLGLRHDCLRGHLGLVGAVVVEFSFVLVLLLCVCKGCRCLQILKKRPRYVPVATKD